MCARCFGCNWTTISVFKLSRPYRVPIQFRLYKRWAWVHAVVKCFFEYLIWSGKIPVQSHTFIMHCFNSNSYLCENVCSCCMHNKCRGLYGNLTPSKSHDFGLYVGYDLFCLHVEALQMIQLGQPKSGKDRLLHSGHTAVHVYPQLFRTVCGFFNVPYNLSGPRLWGGIYI